MLVCTPVAAAASATSRATDPRACGSVHLLGDWGGRVGLVEIAHGAFPCVTAMRVARRATSKPFTVGQTLPALAGWKCAASLRPELGYKPRYVLGCWQLGTSGRFEIGVRYPTTR